MLGQCPEQSRVAVEIGAGLLHVHLQPVMHLGVEMFEQLLACIVHGRGDLLIHLRAERLEGGFDLLFGAAILIDACNPALEIDARFYCAKNVVTRAEHPVEQLEFF